MSQLRSKGAAPAKLKVIQIFQQSNMTVRRDLSESISYGQESSL